MTETKEQSSIDSMSVWHLRILGGVFQGGILIAACALAWFMAEPFWRDMDFSAYALGMGALFTLPMLAGVVWMAETSSTHFDRIRRDFDLVIGLFRKLTVLDILVLSILAGVGEEALFRGVFQNSLMRWTGPAAALVAISALFGLVHFVSAMYAFYAFIIGLYLGGLYLWSGNIAIPMAVHSLYDFLAILYGVHRPRSRKSSAGTAAAAPLPRRGPP